MTVAQHPELDAVHDQKKGCEDQEPSLTPIVAATKYSFASHLKGRSWRNT